LARFLPCRSVRAPRGAGKAVTDGPALSRTDRRVLRSLVGVHRRLRAALIGDCDDCPLRRRRRDHAPPVRRPVRRPAPTRAVLVTAGLLQIGVFLVVLLALAKPLGSYMARVYDGEPTFMDRVVGPLERFVYRVCGVRPDEGMTWKTYAIAMLLFNALGVI